MKNLKRILSLLLVAIMLISSVPTISAASVTFTDVADHWAWKQGQIPYLAEKGVINGIKQSNGTYKFEPDSPVTRAQFVKMLVETFGLVETTSINYNDIKSNDWFYTHFQKAAAQGFLINYGKTVNPNANIPREEAVALIMRYLDLDANAIASASTFTDTDKISSYYRQDVLQAVEAGIINGIKQSDGTYKFEPQKSLTRAESLTVIFKAVGCIFNETTYSRDASAFTTNNIINKGGININGVNFNGRNLITEGAASGKVTLTNCKVNGTLYVRGTSELVLSNTDADKIVIIGGGKVTLQNGSVIDVLNIEKSNSIALTNGTIGELNIMAKASNVTVTGTGTIENAIITASGFKSSVVPEEFDIANGLTATFGTTTYEGNSATAKAYLSAPYATSDGSFFYINVKTGYSGKIRFYYTNESRTPTQGEFDIYHANSQYTGSFDVKADEMTSAKTAVASAASKFKYVVIQLVSGPTKYSPIVVSNAVLAGDGFTTNPAVVTESSSTVTISFVPESAGTVYWYLSDNGTLVNQAEFLEEYAKKESVFKGKITATKNKEATLSISSRYMSNYPFVVFMAANSSGTNYVPVILSTGDTGFKNDPTLLVPGEISYNASVNGTIYYYLSATGTVPTAEDYYKTWQKTSSYLRGKSTTEKDADAIMTFNTRYVSQYPYMIIALADGNDNFYIATVLYVNYTTGMKVEPVFSPATNAITFTPEVSGSVKYYYTKDAAVPNPDEFSRVYNDTMSAYTGKIEVTANKAATIKCTYSYLTRLPYVVIMLTDSNGNEYFPIVINAGGSYESMNGFKTAPSYSSSAGKVSYTVYNDCYVYYYYTNAESPRTESQHFLADWNATSTSASDYAASGQINYIVPNTSYKKMVIAVVTEDEYGNGVAHNVCVVSLEDTPSGGDENLTGLGFAYTIFGKNLFIMPSVTGTLYYYTTTSTADFPNGDFVSAYSSAAYAYAKPAVAGTQIDLACSAKYMVFCLKTITGSYYDYIILDTETKTVVNEDLPDDYGFTRTYEDGNAVISSHRFEGTATVTGRLEATLTINGQSTIFATLPVTAGAHFSLSFDSQLKILQSAGAGGATGTFTFQIIGSDGTEYQPISYSSSQFK